MLLIFTEGKDRLSWLKFYNGGSRGVNRQMCFAWNVAYLMSRTMCNIKWILLFCFLSSSNFFTSSEMFIRTHYLPASRGLGSEHYKRKNHCSKNIRTRITKARICAYEMYRGNCRSVLVVVVALFIRELSGSK